MTESEIIELAKKYVSEYNLSIDHAEMTLPELLAFATEIRNRTLDEAAGVCVKMVEDCDTDDEKMIAKSLAYRIAALKGGER